MLKGEKKAGDGLRVKINLVRYGGKKATLPKPHSSLQRQRSRFCGKRLLTSLTPRRIFIANEDSRAYNHLRFKRTRTARPKAPNIFGHCHPLPKFERPYSYGRKRLAEYFPIKMPPQENLADAAEIKTCWTYIRVSG